MDYSQSEQFANNLLPVLKKLLGSKNVEEAYMDKTFASIDNEFLTQHSHATSSRILCEWLSDTMKDCTKQEIGSPEAEFLCKLIGLLSKYNEAFCILETKKVLKDLISLLEHDLLNHAPVKITFIKMLCAMLNHNSGYNWICTSQVWKLIVSIYFSSANLYVEREGMKFFKKLITTTKQEVSITEDIFLHVFSLVQQNFNNIERDRKMSQNILPSLKLFEMILQFNIFSENSGFHSKIEKTCNFEKLLNNVIENFEQETILEAALVSQVLFSILKIQDKENILCTENIPAVLNVFNILIKQKQFNCILKLAKYCKTLWNKKRIQMNYEDTFGVNFILIQLLPSLMCINLPNTDTQYNSFVKKVFSQKSPELQKFFNLLEKEIKRSFGSKPSNLAAKSISTININLNSYSHGEAVLILQALIYTTKTFIFENGYDLEGTAKKYIKLKPNVVCDEALLLAVLNGFSLILDKFKIHWTDLEELDFFKISLHLLKIPHLPSLVIVQTLLVVKVAISNCIAPSAEINSIITNLKSFGSVVCELMTDSNWEVRDSCIEVVIAIAELSQSGCPAFEQALLEKNFDSILMSVVENDEESYVRASALRALTVMTKTKVLNLFLNDQDSCLKITKLLETESEGIVRREAALLVKEIYLTLGDQHNELENLLYKVMGCAALCDLYWEVKVNSLYFWEAVIQSNLADQGITYASLSNLDSLDKKLINLSNDDMKLRLEKSLKKLSKIGCLHVLLTVLKEDCDIVVIKKSAEVLSDLMNILKQYNVIETGNMPSCSTLFRKRKNYESMEHEKTKLSSPQLIDKSEYDSLEKNISLSGDWSEKVINEIVNDTDINLLKNVSCQNEEIFCCHKLAFLKEIEPEAFLSQMKGFNKDQFLENKQKSFMNVDTELTLTLSQINMEHSMKDTYVMDCY